MTTPAPTGGDGRKPIRTIYNIHKRATMALSDAKRDGLYDAAHAMAEALDDIRRMTDRYRDHWRTYE